MKKLILIFLTILISVNAFANDDEKLNSTNHVHHSNSGHGSGHGGK